MTSKSPQRVAVYTRVSQDRSGEMLAVTRQRERCEALATARGWEVSAVFEDNDISASTGKRREGFEALLASRPSYDAILVWRLDRLLRSNEALIRVLELEVPIHTVEQGDVDVSTSVGRMFLTLLGSIAVEETEAKRQRLKAQRAQAAARGAWHGRRCYGYEADGTVVPEEARIVRQVARDLLSGISLMGVTRWMNETGARTVGGREWTPVLVRQMICAARMSGQREHTTDRKSRRVGFGPIVGPLDGIEPIIPPEWTAELRLLFSDRKRPAGVKQHILGGMLTCGRCGETLTYRRDKTASRWQCIKTPGKPSCGGLGAAAHRIEAAVDGFMIDLLSNPTHLDITTIGERPKNLPTMQDLDQRRSALAVALADGQLTLEDFKGGLARLAQLREQVVTSQTIHPWGRFIYMALELKGESPEERWRSADDDRKRSMLACVVESIVINPASRRGAPWDASRVVITTRPRK